jgi:hypothetical protein
LAAAYVLDADATARLRDELGPGHAVAPGTVRTFLPGVDPSSDLDRLRHRVLTTQRIVREEGARVTRLLGWRAREVIIERALPRTAVRVAQILDRVDEEALARFVPRPVRAVEPVGLAPRPAGAAVITVDVRQHVTLAHAVRAVFGTDRVDTATITELGRLALVGRDTEANEVRRAARAAELQSRLVKEEETRQELAKRLEDEQLEHAQTSSELLVAERLVQKLRTTLTLAGQAELAWTAPADDGDAHPSSFDDLLERLPELSLVRFTGDKDIALGLDQHDPMGRWAAKAWDALVALQDYARASADGRCERDVAGYLRHTPAGCRGFSVNRHASDESDDVRNNPRYAGLRLFPVPLPVAAAGRVFMGAHFKIAQSGTVSPRLYYWDDSAHTGRVYVGYLGPHLHSKRTN